jgi:hypothetical protein
MSTPAGVLSTAVRFGDPSTTSVATPDSVTFGRTGTAAGGGGASTTLGALDVTGRVARGGAK